MNQKVLYPLPTDDLMPWVQDFILRERLRRDWGAIVMDTSKVLDRQHVDLVVIPGWAQRLNKKTGFDEIFDEEVLDLKALA